MNRLRLRFVLILLGTLAAMPAFANDTVYYYHTDAQGTAVVVTDANHNVVERTYYGPYGEVLNRALRDGPGYTGHEEDAATGLDNMQQRYYDPITGRFPSVDPMPVDTTTGANFNRYAYANDNPYRYTDPDGRMANQDQEPSPCTGSHIGGGACGSLNLSRIQVGMPSKSEEQQMQAQTRSSESNQQNSSVPQKIRDAAKAVTDRTSGVVDGGLALGPGIGGEATKQAGSKPDSVAGEFVVGEGAYIGARLNFQAIRWGRESSSATTGKLTIDPSSYLRIKVGAGLSLGISVDLYPRGGAVSVSFGGGFGEEVIVKPPADAEIEHTF